MIAQLLRFGLVGAGVNLILYGIYLVLVALSLSITAAATLVFLGGIGLSYTSHRRITFGNAATSNRRRMMFALLYLAGYGIQIGLLNGLVWSGMAHQIAQLVAMICVAVFYFVMQRQVIFRGPAAASISGS